MKERFARSEGEEKKKNKRKETMREKHPRVGKRTCPKGGRKNVVKKERQEILGDMEKRYGKKGEERRKERTEGRKPVTETKTVKRSGRGIQVPKRVSESRGEYRGAKWRVEAGRKRGKKNGRGRKDGRRRERRRAYEERQKRKEAGKSESTGGEKGKGKGTRRKIQSEPRLNRSRRHKAAKANRVNRRK